jgi:HEAT repeat protein
MPFPDDQLPQLLLQLRGANPEQRGTAACLLGRLNRPIPEVIAGLRQAMESDPDSTVRMYASSAYYIQTRDGETFIDFIVNELRVNTDPVMLECMLNDIAAVKSLGVRALSECVRLLVHEEWGVRLRAAEALGNMGADAAPAVPALIATLPDETPSVRSGVAFALGHIGPAAADAVPALVELLQDENREVRSMASVALGRIGPPAGAARPALATAFKDPFWQVRCEAIRAITRIGQPYDRLLPALIEALTDEEGAVVGFAADAIAELGEHGRTAASALAAALLRVTHPSTRDRLRQAIARVSGHDEPPQ